MRGRPDARKVRVTEPPGSLAASLMKRVNFFAVALACAAAPLCIVLSAKADLAQLNDGAPLLFIKSSGGQITVRPTEANGMVRIPGNPSGVRMDRFNVDRNMGSNIVLPAFPGQCGGGGLLRRKRPCIGGPVRLPLNNLREGPHGVAITNPGGDLSVGVPQRFDAMFVNAGASPVLLEQTRGPFIIVGDNDVTLRGVGPRGWVRTTRGTVDVRNPAGALRVDTQSGSITMQTGPALEAAQVSSVTGDITWTLNGTGTGPYRVMAGSGVVRVLLRPGIAANVDVVSENGSVVNNMDPSVANVLLSRPHAVSLTVGGGGAQLTVHSMSGTVIISPA
jgi:hypothetical protein